MSVQAKNSGLGSGTGGGFIQLYYNNTSGSSTVKRYIIDKNAVGWNKYSITIEYPSDAGGPLGVVVGLINNTGSVYFDEIQLEEGTIANQYNMIENSEFDCSGNYAKNWITYNTNPNIDWVALANGSNFYKLQGEATVKKYVRQDVITKGKKGDIFSISAWIYAGGVRNKNNTTVTDFTVCVIGNNNEEQWRTVRVDPSDQWQFVQQEFIAEHDYKKIQVYFCFYENLNVAYITNVSLYKDYFGQSYQYDSNGNLIKSQDLAKQNNTFNYDGNDNLIKYTNPEGGTFEYQYDTTYKHRLVKAISSTGENYNFSYNQYGQATSAKITNNKNSKYIETNAEYTENGNYLTKIKDENGNTTTYTYNQTNGNLDKVTDAKGNETNYTYDTLGRVKSVSRTAGNKTYQNSYVYTDDRINSIKASGTEYNFTYDTFGNKEDTRLKNPNKGYIILVSQYYEENNGNLQYVQYANQMDEKGISYTYDKFNRLRTQRRDQGMYKYEYDAQSNLAYIETPEGNQERYTYDLAGRLVNANDDSGFSKKYKYDKNNNIISRDYLLPSNNSGTTYEYDNQNRLIGVYMSSQDFNESNIRRIASVNISYDEFSRVSSKLYAGTNAYSQTFYEYENLGENRTTNRVSKIDGDVVLRYTYDELGNIKTVRGTENATYYYDELNQLVREDNENLNKTITYTYDLGGNVTTKKEYSYTTGELGTAKNTITYEYEDQIWKDKLTSYNGKIITYDAMGNPLTYAGNTYTWQNGRELKSITNEEQELSINYKYNDEGIRTEKTVNGVTTEYYLEGTKVIYEKNSNSNKTIYYYYDNEGEILGLRYNGVAYLYVKNLQGDILGILDNQKNMVVSYKYDSWGNLISIEDTWNGGKVTDPNHVGIVNPYRYRSYRYDEETGLYYLNSRYYNPEWGRFLNADDVLMESGSIIDNNLYVYCMNNPINLSDPNGNFAISAFLKTVGNVVKKAVQTVATALTKALPDYSKELNKVILQNTYEIITIKEQFGGEVAAMEFYHSVNTGGIWDYKIPKRWKESINVQFLGYNKPFIYNGVITTAEEFGNIHYGFVGSAVGFSPTILFIGGGYAANKRAPINVFTKANYGDSIEDHNAIQRGINMYNYYFK